MKTRSRRLLLLLGVLAVVVGGLALYRSRESARDQEARDARELGLAAFDEGRFDEAVGLLGTYINRLKGDPLALLRYAQATCRVPASSSNHFDSAIIALRRCVSGSTGEEATEARRLLLKIFPRIGALAEAQALADWFLEHDLDTEEAALVRASCLAGMHREQEALEFLEERAASRASGTRETMLRVRLMAAVGRGEQALRQTAEAWRAARPGDDAARAVEAQAAVLVDDRAGARAALEAVLPAAARDPRLARALVPLLDRMGLGRESLSLMLGVDAFTQELEFLGDLACRLWEAGRDGDVLERARAWQLPPKLLPSRALGYMSLAALRVEDRGEVVAWRDELARRREDLRSTAWGRLLDVQLLGGDALLAESIAGCQGALEADRDLGPAHLFLARAYETAGEPELALAAYRAAARSSPTWIGPVLEALRTLAVQARLGDATALAKEVKERGHTDPSIEFLLALGDASAGGPTADTPGARLEEAWREAKAPSGELASLQLAIAVAKRDTDRARVATQALLAQSPVPPESALLAAAAASRAMGMGREADLLDLHRRAYGATPEGAVYRARVAALEAGDAESGWKVFQAERTSAPTSQAWDVAEAVWHEGQGDLASAANAWRRVVRADPRDPRVLLQMLASRAAWTDPALSLAAISRLEALTGSTCLWWQHYRARSMLTAGEGKPSPAVIADVVRHLRSVLDAAPDRLASRMLLVSALEQQGEWKKALEQTRIARGDAPRSTGLELVYARLLHRTGDEVAARQVLDALSARAASMQGPERAAAAALMARMQDQVALQRLLATEDPQAALAASDRAAFLAASGAFDQARSLLANASNDEMDAHALALAAALAEFEGDRTEADALLARAAAREPDALAADRLRVAHYLRVGRSEEALQVLRRLTGGGGATRADTLELLTVLLQLGDAEGLRDAFEAGGELSPLAPEEAALVVEAAKRPESRDLGVQLLQRAEVRAPASRAIQLLAELPDDRIPPNAAQQLEELLRSQPAFGELRTAAAQAYLHRGNADRAAELAWAAAQLLPESTAPLRVAAIAERRRGNADRATDAARRWRELADGPALEPAYFLAERAAPAEAAELLAPYVGFALTRGLEPVLSLYGAALADGGQEARLIESLRPRLAAGAPWREAWIRTASAVGRAGRREQAEALLEAEVLVAEAERDDVLRVHLARAWQELAVADRTSRGAAERARFWVVGIRPDADLGAPEWETVGQVREAQSDAAGAESAYRSALREEPRSVVAANNLAMILTTSGRAGEALPLARGLVDAHPRDPRLRDTLARVHVGLGHPAEALAQFEECLRLAPEVSRWMVLVLEQLVAAGEVERARERYGELSPRVVPTSLSPDLASTWTSLQAQLGEPR